MVEAQEKLEFAQGKSPCVFLRPTRPELEWIDHIKSVPHCSPETEPPTSTRAVSCPVGLSLQPVAEDGKRLRYGEIIRTKSHCRP